MIDRFGLLPDPIKHLFTQASIRVQAQRLGIAEIEATASGGSIEFTDKTRVNPLSIVKLIQSDPSSYSLAGASRLRFKRELPDLAARNTFLESLLESFKRDAEMATP